MTHWVTGRSTEGRCSDEARDPQVRATAVLDRSVLIRRRARKTGPEADCSLESGFFFFCCLCLHPEQNSPKKKTSGTRSRVVQS